VEREQQARQFVDYRRDKNLSPTTNDPKGVFGWWHLSAKRYNDRADRKLRWLSSTQAETSRLMKCQICNAESAAGAAFCQQCGAKLPPAEAGAARAATATADASSKSTATPAGRPRGPSDIPEETLWEGSYSPKAMLGTLVLCGLLSVALLIAAFLLSATVILSAVLVGAVVVVWIAAAIQFARNRLGKSYRLTNQMLYHRNGVLNRVTDRIELIEIHDVTWQQGLVQRLVDVGTVKISSADHTHGKLEMDGIENVEAVASQIDKARRAEQVRRGRRIDFSNVDGQT
jgi:membrane protein YdbS with pleckstrin-like domain